MDWSQEPKPREKDGNVAEVELSGRLRNWSKTGLGFTSNPRSNYKMGYGTDGTTLVELSRQTTFKNFSFSDNFSLLLSKI